MAIFWGAPGAVAPVRRDWSMVDLGRAVEE